jgi:hypothetical protein
MIDVGERVRRPRRRRPWLGASVIAAAVSVFVLVWFQPQKLFIDEQVNEALPMPVGAAGSTEPDAPGNANVPRASAEPREVVRGTFISRDHGTSGTARIVQLPDGRSFLRIEGLKTDDGPDLFVYLTANPADGEEGAFDDQVVNLGRLKGNEGDQNYELPAQVGPTDYGTVVIWCDRFNSAFGAADLS